MRLHPRFAFYGTLRTGMYNYKAFASSLRYTQTCELSGYEMYAKEAYPYAIYTQDSRKLIVVDLMEVLTYEAENSIHKLEIDAGYFLDYVMVNDEKFGIYLYSQNLLGDPLIESGDWVKYRGQLGF